MKVRQVENVLDLFELFAKEKAPRTLTDLARGLDMPKSSTFNLIDTLLSRGYLYQIRQRGGYYPTRRLQDVAAAIMEGDALLESIHGELEALAAATGETVLLSTRRDHEVLYLDVVESSSPIRYHARIGDRRPLYPTSSGKAILTTYDRSERQKIMEDLVLPPRQKGARKRPEQLAADLDAAARRGWTEDRAEFIPDVMGIGVPLVHGDRRFGLAVAGPLYRMRPQRAELVAQLRETVARIHRIFEGREPPTGAK